MKLIIVVSILCISLHGNSQVLPIPVFLDITENFPDDTARINKILKDSGMRQIRDGRKGGNIEFGAWTDSTSFWEKDAVVISRYLNKYRLTYITYTKKIYDTWENDLTSAGYSVKTVKKHKQSNVAVYTNGKINLVIEVVTLKGNSRYMISTNTAYY